MSVTLAGGCRVFEMREGVPVINGTLGIWNQIGRPTGAQAISLRIMEFAPGLSLGIRNGDWDEILYMPDSAEGGRSERGHPVRLSEHGERTAADEHGAKILIDGRSYELAANTGIYIRPGQTYSIDNPGPNPILIVSSRCPEPRRRTRARHPTYDAIRLNGSPTAPGASRRP